jgi:hypothetical protein
VLEAWLVDDNLLLLTNFGPYGIIFMNVYVAITVAMVMLLRGFWASCLLSICWLVGDYLLFRDFGPCMILFMMCVLFSRCHSDAVKEFWVLWDNVYDCVCLPI